MKVVRWVMLLAAVVAFVGGLYMFQKVRRHPLEIAELIGRRELERHGLVRREFPDVRGGAVVAWSRGGELPVLVLVHGEDGSAAGFSPLVARLPSERSLVVPDLPGHGESAPHAGALTLDELAEGLRAVLAGLPPQQPRVVVAHSLGVPVALLALDDASVPRPAALVLVAPWTLRGDDGAFAALFPQDEDAALSLIRREQRVEAPPVPDYLPRARVRLGRDGPLARLRADLVRREAWPERRPDGVPLHIVLPQEDRIMPAERAAALATRLGAASVVALPSCGHIPQQECPDRLAETLLELVAFPAD